MKTMLIIDGNSILNRTYYGIKPLITKDGIFTNAIYGMVNILLKQLENLKPHYAVIAFDLKSPTFRHKKYKDYKSNRKGMPDELASQLPYAKECAEKLGFTVVSKDGYEADDLIGTFANLSHDKNIETFILTGDRDALQLITKNVKVLLMTNSDIIMFDNSKFIEIYGVNPSQFVDVKALMGDNSDNIPGIAGIGEKTALKLISLYDNIENIYYDILNKDIPKSSKNKLILNRENAFLSKELSTIDVNVPIDIGLDDVYSKEIVQGELIDIFTKLEFFSIIKKLNLTVEAERITVLNISYNDLFKLPKDKVYCISLKHDSLYITSEKKNYRYVYPDISCLKPLFEDSSYSFCIYDYKTNYLLLKEHGINFTNCVFDIMLGAYLISPSDSTYDVPYLVSKYLKLNYDENNSVENDLLYKLYIIFKALIEEKKQENLYYNIEMPLAKVLADMEIKGFKIDKTGLSKFSQKLQASIIEKMEHIYSLAGCTFNINSPKQLGILLFEKLGFPLAKKTKTSYSTNMEILEKLRPYHPIINSILEYRKLTKLKNTYVERLLKNADENDRVHSKFNQTITSTGRLSSTEPNLQNIPIHQELGREIRQYFIPENNDYILIDADYSQIEVRLLATISEDETLINAFKNGLDIHTITASKIFNISEEDVTPELRKRAKIVNFGIMYGMGDFSLANEIGVTKYEASKYIKNYFLKYSKVDLYVKNVVKSARENGYVSTLFGRIRYVPELKSSKVSTQSAGERIAMNSPIQGTAADIIKLAMVNIDKRLSESGIDAKLILQVHDELILESNKNCVEEATQILKQEMENVIDLIVPLTVNISLGNTWFDN